MIIIVKTPDSVWPNRDGLQRSRLNLGPGFSDRHLGHSPAPVPERVVLGHAPHPRPAHGNLSHGPVSKFLPSVVSHILLTFINNKLGGFKHHQCWIAKIVLDSLDGSNIFDLKVFHTLVPGVRRLMTTNSTSFIKPTFPPLRMLVCLHRLVPGTKSMDYLSNSS